MNTIITVKQLVSMIAQASGADNMLVTRFVDEFTRAVGSALEHDGRVEIDGFGIFMRDGIGGDRITFVPDNDIAAAVNAPFDMFEPVVLDENYVEEPVAASVDGYVEEPVAEAIIEPVVEPVAEPATEAKTRPTPPPTPVRPPVPVLHESESASTPASESTPVSEPVMTPGPEPVSEPAPEVATTPIYTAAPEACNTPAQYDGDDADYESYYENRKRHSFRSYVLILVGFVMLSFIIGTVAGYFAYPLLNNILSYDDHIVVEETAVEDIPVDTRSVVDDSVSSEAEDDTDSESADETVVNSAAKSAPEIVTDTVEAGNSLAKIARTHYGKSDFWVYIYEANADKLGNPDNIASGTVLVIPPASQYEIDPNDPESIRKARAKASQIYNKYR